MTKAEYIHLIKRTNSLMNQAIDDILKYHGLARSQYQALYFIASSTKASQKELIQKMKIEPATLSGIIDTLVMKKYIKKAQFKEDKRLNKLELTQKGQNLMSKIEHPGLSVEKTMFKNFVTSDKKALKDNLLKIINNLENN